VLLLLVVEVDAIDAGKEASVSVVGTGVHVEWRRLSRVKRRVVLLLLPEDIVDPSCPSPPASSSVTRRRHRSEYIFVSSAGMADWVVAG
jgi:hypothetical protein